MANLNSMNEDPLVDNDTPDDNDEGMNEDYNVDMCLNFRTLKTLKYLLIPPNGRGARMKRRQPLRPPSFHSIWFFFF